MEATISTRIAKLQDRIEHAQSQQNNAKPDQSESVDSKRDSLRRLNAVVDFDDFNTGKSRHISGELKTQLDDALYKVEFKPRFATLLNRMTELQKLSKAANTQVAMSAQEIARQRQRVEQEIKQIEATQEANESMQQKTVTVLQTSLANQQKKIAVRDQLKASNEYKELTKLREESNLFSQGQHPLQTQAQEFQEEINEALALLDDLSPNSRNQDDQTVAKVLYITLQELQDQLEMTKNEIVELKQKLKQQSSDLATILEDRARVELTN